jgi:hypothetical protein
MSPYFRVTAISPTPQSTSTSAWPVPLFQVSSRATSPELS